MRKSVWLLSASLCALSFPAYAQDNDSDATQPTSPSATEQAAVEPGTQAVAEAEPDEIVVTAQGRRQILQDVPIAVTAIGADAMQNSGASDIRQLNQLAPSLLVSSTGTEANGSARIRGIGTVGDNPGLESSVAVFIDGVYRSRSGIGLTELGEIDRIEVLRGPQGTLFGRNASAGLINIISKRPSFNVDGYGELTLGNYDLRRVAGGITGPISSTVAARIDAVYVSRDGFYRDEANDTRVNDRNRLFTRGQLLFEPSSDLSLRFIADYTTRNESCCGAVYVNNDINDQIGDLNNPSTPISPVQPNGNNIVNVLTALGQDPVAFDNGWSREIWVTPGRDYKGKTTDGGLSLEAKYDMGGAELTSITGYRAYKSEQNGDLDYSTVDIWYRADEDPNYRQFKTFSQELRLQGSAFADRLDWLVGGYYAHERLRLADTVVFGEDWGRFMTCRLVSGSTLGAFYNPANTGCLAAPARAGIAAGLSPLGAAGPTILAAIDRLDGISEVGSTGDFYRQTSRNWALFTHNIFHVTDQIDVTVGLRYTNEKKKFDAEFGNNNLACPQNQAALGAAGFLNPLHPLFATAGAIVSLSCATNSTAELNGVEIEDSRKEDEFTGTGVLSWKPSDQSLFYASYSRGYKAGGFNLDRSALKPPAVPFSSIPGGAQALVGGLQFDPEIVDAYELGAKLTFGRATFNVSLFRQDFDNFQLNTFDGTVFIVQNINGCTGDLGTTDEDLSAATGACDSDDVTYGVRSQGIELEASLRPTRDLRLNAGFTYANTKYRGDLVGTDDGTPLNPALRRLPGRQLSNAPKTVATGAISWTPPIGGSGLSGLFYIDARHTGKFNTGSDLFPQKMQKAFTLVNARVGVRGQDDRWALELWAQNLFDKNYQQVAFNSPVQAGLGAAPFVDPGYPGGRQLFSAFLAEPRMYGLTLRARFGGGRSAPAYVAPPQLPEPAVEQPAPPPPPPPPPPAEAPPPGERG